MDVFAKDWQCWSLLSTLHTGGKIEQYRLASMLCRRRASAVAGTVPGPSEIVLAIHSRQSQSLVGNA